MKKSGIAFILALISISFFVCGLIISFLNREILDRSDQGGLLIFISGIIALIGIIFSLIGIKEPNSYKKIIGMAINFLIVLIYLSLVIISILDLSRYFF